MENKLIKELINTFKEETEKYSNLLNGVTNYVCNDFYKQNNPEKGYHSVDASIMFKNFTLKLEYKINISMLVPKSILEMRFIFENGKLPIEYSMYDLLNIIDKDNFKCYTFSYITDQETVIEAVKYLIDTFNEYREKIEYLSQEDEQIKSLEKNINDNIDVLIEEKIFESRDANFLMRMLDLYYIIDVSRFTTDMYIYYLDGKYKKAVNKYKKLKNKITIYEKRLIEHMEKENIEQTIPDKLNTLCEARSLKNSIGELISMFISWLALTPIWYIAYSIIFNVVVRILTKDAIYVGGSYSIVLLMPSFITATINSFFIRKIVYKICFRKNYKKVVALDEIENTVKVTEIMSKLFQFIIAAGLVFTLLAANTNIIFYDEYFVDNLGLLKLKGENIKYEDVDCVYKVEKIINDFGQVLEIPTYVIVLKGDRQIDLYYDVEIVDIEENVIPILKTHNIEIKQIDMIENIKNK